MKNTLKLGALALALAVTGCNKDGGGSKGTTGAVTLKTEVDKTFYAVGHMFGGRLSQLNLNDAELAALGLGLRDSAKGADPKVKIAEYQPKVQKLFKERMEKKAKEVKVKGAGFINEFIKKEKGMKTASGLAYKIIKKGKGKTPKATDTVRVHYHGTLTNGEVFDSSVDRGKDVSFPLNRVIKGWTEGLQLLKEGGKIKLVIPSELAYGDQGAPPKIPGGATLVFEVELFEVKAPEKHSKGDGHNH